MQVETQTYEVPQRFFDDHNWRDLINDPFEVIAVKRHTYLVNLSKADAEELMSDALYYALGNCDALDDLGLVSSARATVGRLIKQGLHDYETRDWHEVKLLNKFRAKYGFEVK